MYQDNFRHYERDGVDYGSEPFVVDTERVVKRNSFFRRALWTGEHLQMTIMSIPVGGEIGLESHSDLDQYLHIVEGNGFVKMGKHKERLNYQRNVESGYGVFVPAGTWHNLMNVGGRPIKLFSIYAPPAHPHGTIHETKAYAEMQEGY